MSPKKVLLFAWLCYSDDMLLVVCFSSFFLDFSVLMMMSIYKYIYINIYKYIYSIYVYIYIYIYIYINSIFLMQLEC